MAEDDPNDQELARLAVQRLERPCSLEIVEDGRAALEYLEAVASEPGSSSRRPSQLLVDLAMPNMDGLSLIRSIRESPAWRRLPLVVFTTSSAERDVTACYEAGCNSYVVKPFSMKELTTALEDIMDYWLGVARLPG